MLKLLLLFIFFTSMFVQSISYAVPIPALKETVVVVDKKTNALHLTNYNDGRLEITKSYHATLGQKIGDKLMEGDLKTPEGIYEFLFRSEAPKLKPMFGPLAIYVSYPNPMDRTGKKTGFDILIHGTDNPARLEKAFDSKGCVVLDNGYVKEVSENVKLHDTKIIITRDFSLLQNNARLDRLKEFVTAWLKAWQDKNIDAYAEMYADEFSIDKMNRIEYAKYKNRLAEKYDTISIKLNNIHYFLHEKYDLVTFDQVYKSTFPGGKPAYNGTSKKRLFVQERNGHYRIVIEDSKKDR